MATSLKPAPGLRLWRRARDEPARAGGRWALPLAPHQNDKGRHGRCESSKLPVLSAFLKGDDPRADREPGAESSGPPGLHQHVVVSPGPDGCAALALSHSHCSPCSPPALVGPTGPLPPRPDFTGSSCAAAPAKLGILSALRSELSPKRGGSAVKSISLLPSRPSSARGAKLAVLQSVSHGTSLACTCRTWPVAVQAFPLAWDSGSSLSPSHHHPSSCSLSLAESAWS